MEKIEIGDHILVEAVVRLCDNTTNRLDISLVGYSPNKDGTGYNNEPDENGEIKVRSISRNQVKQILPRPLQVGEKVRSIRNPVEEYKILAINGNRAWIKCISTPELDYTVNIDTIQRI